MASNSRHLYPEWLRPRNARDAAPAGGRHDREEDGVWRVWEWLRAFDRRYASLVDVVLATGLFFLCSGWVIERPVIRPDLWFVVALIFPLVFRRRAPMTVFLVIATVAFVQWLVTGPTLADAALLVALYTVALESEWLLVTAATVILEAGVVMATVRWDPTRNKVHSFVFLTGLVFTALLAGVVVRALRSQLDWLAERAERLERERDQQASLAAATERARIAREMHDVVSHNIQVMVTLADAASSAQASDPARAAEAINEVSSTGRQALTDMRRMLGVLREEPTAVVGHGDGVAANGNGRPPLAPQPGLGELDALVDRVRGTGLDVSVEHRGTPFDVSGAAGLTVYRIVQEALTNVLKHAEQPASVVVRLAFDDPDVSVWITDDGRTKVAVPASPSGNRWANGNGNGRDGAAGGGHGLAGMAERAGAFGGTLSAAPRPTGGWEVAATLRDCKAPAPA